MGVIVQFDYLTWSQLFPQFANNVNQAQVESLILPLAEQYCRNDGTGPVNSAQSQTNLLNLMVAHITQLLFGSNGNPPSPIVGRINSASEGTVSVAAEFPAEPGAVWFNQTPFGAAFYQASLPYRLFRYRPAARTCRGW